MTLSAGTRLGSYELIAPIGEGGMGRVFRARDTRLDRFVAIKVLPESVAGDAERRARFEREAKAIAALSHPNILAIYEFGEHDGIFYAATELLEGETLRDQLSSGPLPPRKLIDLGVQIARGLSAAHDRGIVHRDLKPENLFLVSDGQIKILDFGLARHVSTTSGSGATETMAATDPGKVMGTVGYMAPEQVRGLAIDARADLFSLGAVLYEMATGRRAFDRATAADTISAILREDPPDVTATQTSVSPALDRIIRHCLEKDPTERFQTARDVGFALSSLSGSATSASGATVVMPAPAPRRRAWLLPAVIAATLAAAGFAFGRLLAPVPEPLTFAPMTRSPQAIFNARFMPDGRRLVFSSALEGSASSLFEAREDGGAPRPFGPPRSHLLSISKTGELAVLTDATFIAHRLMTGTLGRMAIDGAPRAIAEDVREADWLPDGNLAVVRDLKGEDQLEFPLGHVVYRTAGYVSDPRVSPDGTRLAFMDHQVRFDNRGWVKVVDGNGTVTTLAGEFRGGEGVVWSRDGRTIYYSASDAGEYQIFSVPSAGGEPAAVYLGTAGSLVVHDVAADGLLAASREDIRYGVVARGAGQDAERDLTPLDQAWIPTLSPDGKFAVFTDGRGGHDYAVVLRGVDGSPPARLGDGNAWDVSPDGRWVTATIPSTSRCVVYPTGAGAMVPIEMGPLESCAMAFWFPDGKSLIIAGNERGRPLRAYRAAFPGGTPEAYLPEGLNPQRISTAGTLLVRDRSGAWLRMRAGAEPAPVKGLAMDDAILDWSADERTVTVGERAKIPSPIFRVRLDTGERVRIGEFAPADRAGLLSIFPAVYRDDGRQYIYAYTRRVSVLYTVR